MSSPFRDISVIKPDDDDDEDNDDEDNLDRIWPKMCTLVKSNGFNRKLTGWFKLFNSNVYSLSIPTFDNIYWNFKQAFLLKNLHLTEGLGLKDSGISNYNTFVIWSISLKSPDATDGLWVRHLLETSWIETSKSLLCFQSPWSPSSL